MTRARDCFAAVVHWCPNDLEARNALAMACFELGDKAQARFNWERTQQSSPIDALSKAGIAMLDSKTSLSEKPKGPSKRPQKHHKTKNRSRKNRRKR